MTLLGKVVFQGVYTLEETFTCGPWLTVAVVDSAYHQSVVTPTGKV